MPDQYQTANDFETSQGVPVIHGHLITPDFTQTEKDAIRSEILNQFPGVSVMREATKTYNCHAFAHAQRHIGWFNEVGQFIADDYEPMTPSALQADDRVVYSKNGQPQHSGILTVVSGGKPAEVRSKWGNGLEVLHAPTTVPANYGSISYFLRRRTRALSATDERIMNERIEDLIVALTSEERRHQLDFASTPETAATVAGSHAELPELEFYGDRAVAMIADRLSRLDLQRALPLVIVLGRMGTRAALLALAPIVAALDQDAISIPEQILFSVFDDLHRHLTEAPNEARQRILTEARALIAGQ